MKSSTTRKIGDILQDSVLNRIVRQANELNTLNDKIRRLLPEMYAGLYRLRNLSDNQLTFEVPNAVIRQGMLLQQAAILRLIQQDYPHIRHFEVRINPNFKF